MIRFTVFSLLFGSGMTQISPIRDPAIPVAPTIGPAINTIAPIRTVQPIRTISPGIVVTSTNTPLITTLTTLTSTAPNAEISDDLILIYALVPTGILVFLVFLLCLRKKRAIINNNVVNVDIENVLPSTLVKQPSIDSNRFANHTYEAVDYESRYEMPDSAKYENVFTGDKGKNNEYGTQVTTIV